MSNAAAEDANNEEEDEVTRLMNEYKEQAMGSVGDVGKTTHETDDELECIEREEMLNKKRLATKPVEKMLAEINESTLDVQDKMRERETFAATLPSPPSLPRLPSPPFLTWCFLVYS